MVKLSDFTESIYAFFYRDTASMIMDRKATELRDMKQHDPEEFKESFIRQQYKKYKILMRARISTYNGGTKVTYSAAKVMPYDIKSENRRLLSRLEIYDSKEDLPSMNQMMFDMNQEANFHGNGSISRFLNMPLY